MMNSGKKTLVSRLASLMKQLFAIMLTACKTEQPHLLWDEFKNIMSEDFLNQARQQNENMSIEFCLEIYNQCHSDLSCRVQDLNSTLTNCGIPESDVRMELHYEIYLETNYDTYFSSVHKWIWISIGGWSKGGLSQYLEQHWKWWESHIHYWCSKWHKQNFSDKPDAC